MISAFIKKFYYGDIPEEKGGGDLHLEKTDTPTPSLGSVHQEQTGAGS